MEPKAIPQSVDIFGPVLDGLFDRVNSSIEQVANQLKNAGMDLEIEAGEEISRAIEQTRNAYQSELNATIDKISTAAKKSLDQLTSIVQAFEKDTGDGLNQLMVQAQQLANSFIFSSKQPQLSSVMPRYLVIDDLATTSLVVFKGNFPSSAKVGFEPTLLFTDKPCYLVDSTTQSLTFQVPHTAFSDVDPAKYGYKTGQLKVPFDDGWIRSHKSEFDYRVGLGALPKIAGNGTVEYIAKTTKRVSQDTVTGNYHYDGNSWYPVHWHEEDLHVYPQPGWTIDTSKPPQVVNFRHEHGKDSAATILSVSATAVVVHVKLYCASGSDMDIFDFQVKFTQYQDQPDEQKRVENFQMNWKDSKLLEPQSNEVISKVTFDDYKQVHQEYGGPSLTSGVLKIADEGNGKWKIWAEPPTDIGLTSSALSDELKRKIVEAHRLKHLLTVANVPREVKVLATSAKKDIVETK